MSQQVSIISPVLNGEKFIAEALSSVVSQIDASGEIIVVDGGSTDGTAARVARFPKVRMETVPGCGLYEALNRGLEMSAGEVIGFLNCDDMYAPGAIDRALQVWRDKPETAVVSGTAEFIVDRDSGVRAAPATCSTTGQMDLTIDNIMCGVPLLNARFYRREVLKSLGGFDCAFSIAADRDLLIRMALSKVPGVVVPALFYRYRMHQGSMTLSGGSERNLALAGENLALAEKYMDVDRYGLAVCRSAERMYYESVVTGLNAAARAGRWRAVMALLGKGAGREAAGFLRVGGAFWRKVQRRLKSGAG